MTDIARSTDEDPRDIVSRRLIETAQNLIAKLRVRGRKRKAGVAKRRQKGGKKPRLTKRDIFSEGASVSLSPPTMSLSLSSEFDIFAPRPIQTSVVETTEVT